MIDVFIAGNRWLAVYMLSGLSVHTLVQVAAISRRMRRIWYTDQDALWLTMYPALYMRLHASPPPIMPTRCNIAKFVAELHVFSKTTIRCAETAYMWPKYSFIYSVSHVKYFTFATCEELMCYIRAKEPIAKQTRQQPYFVTKRIEEETLAKLDRKMQKKQVQLGQKKKHRGRR